MAVKPNAQYFKIKEQIVEDLATGLTFQFSYMPETDAPFRLKIFGDLPYGNREILFDREGNEAGSGTLIARTCPPSWIKAV